jgi:hypothetical protein
MKAYGGGCIDPHFLDLDISWSSVVSFTLWLLYPQGNSPQHPIARRSDGPQSRYGRRGEKEILTLPGLQLRPLGGPARS